MAQAEAPESQETAPPLQPVGNPYLAAVIAWLVPGAGHVYLGRRLRGLAFFLIVATALRLGWSLEGRLYHMVPGQPLSYLGTLAELGLGFGYLLLRVVVGHQGTVTAASYEYGTAFILAAALMNILLILDAWDISRGRKA